MKRIISILLPLCIFCGVNAFAQSAKSERIKPRWIQKLPKPTNTTFNYELDFSVGSSLDEARQKSLSGLIASSGFENGVVVVSNYDSKIVDSQIVENGKIKDVQREEMEINSQIKGNEVSLHIKNVAEYWERDKSGTYHLTKLYAKSTSAQTPNFDNVAPTTKYGARGLWRSMIIPGWGQFHKGSYIKGGLILGGTAVCAAGIVVAEGKRADYHKRMLQTYDVNMIRAYQTKRDNFTTTRNICIGATAALYLYNLIDAIAAPGAQRLVVKRSDAKGNTYTVVPSVSDNGAPVMMAAINF